MDVLLNKLTGVWLTTSCNRTCRVAGCATSLGPGVPVDRARGSPRHKGRMLREHTYKGKTCEVVAMGRTSN